ncbi:amidohydrolase family protein [Actinomadura madurae]|uniref:amidohydrolase family protein n=1 Tax=Actinomadura madurae TaxID=1993 RepID=UPI002026B318|nr:amidohydrolase family protein [Actinomadura madurae]MCP9948268.1 amidohydrolase [Actinomadura madurae]MCP9965038.1 amidohydrolase [Actinomadura madurae]MCP9977533.1 amidohydrolase [Actinomadura madurae]MCQ0010972.1 amidohydrolase [Actinomadura madurae]URM93926.1 amidohydrolase [Actinomadura madurae]
MTEASPQFTDAPIFDADQHMYETADALTRYLPEKYRSAVQFVQVGRRTRIAILNKITDYIPNPTFDRVAAPGAYEPFYSGNNPESKSLKELGGRGVDSIPAWREPEARMKVLDEQGVDSTLVYPTLANLVEHSAAEDPELVVAVMHALNRWMLDQWQYVYQNRLFMTPVISCALVDDARRELEYVIENGAKVVLMKPAPVKGLRGWRSPALPEFDPFWADVQNANIPVVLHASQPPLTDYVNRWEPPATNSAFAGSAFRRVVLGHREIADMLASLICHGTLTRFPKLRIASIENGSHWIQSLFTELEVSYSKEPTSFPEHPIEAFRRNIWVSPFWEGSVEDVVNTVGWDKVLFGSDYPHPEGLAEPKGYFKYAEGMSEKRTYDFMGDNTRRFMGLPVVYNAEAEAPVPA